MIIQMDLYNLNGKFKYGGEVTITEESWGNRVLEEIIENQKVVVNSLWEQEEYYMVTSDLEESMNDRNYKGFYHRLYTPKDLKEANNNANTEGVSL